MVYFWDCSSIHGQRPEYCYPILRFDVVTSYIKLEAPVPCLQVARDTPCAVSQRTAISGVYGTSIFTCPDFSGHYCTISNGNIVADTNCYSRGIGSPYCRPTVNSGSSGVGVLATYATTGTSCTSSSDCSATQFCSFFSSSSPICQDFFPQNCISGF